MEVFKEIINLINVIIWPLVVTVIGFAFKKNIDDIFKRLKGAKYKDLEIDFQKNLQESEDIIIQNSKVSKNDLDLKMSTDFLNNIKSLSDISPRALLTESWIQLETTINQLLMKNNQFSRKPFENFNNLTKNNIIDKSDMAIYKNLRDMRNNAIHNYNFKISQDQAIEYSLLVYRLMENINRNYKE